MGEFPVHSFVPLQNTIDILRVLLLFVLLLMGPLKGYGGLVT